MFSAGKKELKTGRVFLLAVKIVPLASSLFSALVPCVTSSGNTVVYFLNQSLCLFVVQEQHSNKFDVPGILNALRTDFANSSFDDSFLTDLFCFCFVPGLSGAESEQSRTKSMLE